MSIHQEILWSPFSDKNFISFGNNVMMHEISYTEKGNLDFKELWLNTDFPYIKCATWGKLGNNEDALSTECLAIGRSTGHISFFKIPPIEHQNLENKYFLPSTIPELDISPTHNRPVNNVAWNPTYTHLIGATYERHRTDYGLMVYDLTQSVIRMGHTAAGTSGTVADRVGYADKWRRHNRPSLPRDSFSSPMAVTKSFSSFQLGDRSPPLQPTGRLSPGDDIPDPTGNVWRPPDIVAATGEGRGMAAASSGGTPSFPLFFSGYTESMSSFAWIPLTPNAFMVGQNYKQLKIYDLRVSPNNTTLLSSVGASSGLSTPGALTRAVYGIQFDPILPYRLSSFTEDQLHIWDIRNFDKPMNIYTTPDIKDPIIKTSWCPSRSSLLAVVTKGSESVKFLDIGPSPSSSNKSVFDVLITDPPDVVNVRPRSICSFAWNRMIHHSVLALTTTGQLRSIAFPEEIFMDYSSRGCLATCCGPRVLTYLGPSHQLRIYDEPFPGPDLTLDHFIPVRNSPTSDDAEGAVLGASNRLENEPPYEKSSAIYQDIRRSSVEVESKVNALLKVFVSDPYVRAMGRDAEDPFVLEVCDDDEYWPGVCDIMTDSGVHFNKTSSSHHPPSLHLLPWQGPHPGGDRDLAYPDTRPIEYYLSIRRRKVVGICGWDFWLSTPKFDAHIQRLLSKNQNEKAIALTVFRGRIRTAVELLESLDIEETQHSQFATFSSNVATAISGFNPLAFNDLWTRNAEKLLLRHTFPDRTVGMSYLMSVLSFLLAQSYKYTSGGQESLVQRHMDLIVAKNVDAQAVKIMGDFFVSNPLIDLFREQESLPLQDRVAFACLFFDDHKLLKFLRSTSEDCIQKGTLDAIFLIGMNDTSTVRLLENYVNRTLDIATVCAIAIKSPCDDLLHHPSVANWIENYRDLLDRNRLWEKRAEFDSSIFQASRPGSLLPPIPQVFISCNFCGKPITADRPRPQPTPTVVPHASDDRDTLTVGQQLYPGSPPRVTVASDPEGDDGAVALGGSDSLFKDADTSTPLPQPPGTGAVLKASPISPSPSSNAPSSHQSPPLPPLKVSNCHECGKALPRCAICLVGMSASSVPIPLDAECDDSDRPLPPKSKLGTSPIGGDAECFKTGSLNLNPVSEWFSWCQKCAHGGHARHLIQWFESNLECPVSGCDCKCVDDINHIPSDVILMSSLSLASIPSSIDDSYLDFDDLFPPTQNKPAEVRFDSLKTSNSV